MAVTIEKVSDDEAGMRLDRWFRGRYPSLKNGQLQKLLRTGQVRLDGKRAKTDTRIDVGQSVRVPPLRVEETGADRPPALDGDATAIRDMVLFEDDAVLVLNKPYNLAVQGGSGLSRHLDGMLEALRDRQGRKPRLVHRLDRETSGVIIVAKTRRAASELAGSFRSRRTRKIYWALVRGVPKPAQGRISTHIARDEEAERMAIVGAGKDAQHAVSNYSVIENSGQKLAWLTLRPVTGRTHQLRAHCAHIGHPIIGDSKYFDVENWELPGGIQNRLHLHARRLVIPHPSGEGVIDVTAPLPQHMQQSWNLLGLRVGDGWEPDEEEDDPTA